MRSSLEFKTDLGATRITQEVRVDALLMVGLQLLEGFKSPFLLNPVGEIDPHVHFFNLTGIESQSIERFMGRIFGREFIENLENESPIVDDSCIFEELGQVLFE